MEILRIQLLDGVEISISNKLTRKTGFVVQGHILACYTTRTFTKRAYSFIIYIICLCLF